MNKILRSIYLVMLIAGLSTPAAAKKSTLNLKGHASTGLNALDYKLQKPLGNDTFPAGQDGFDQNFFIGGGLGLSTQTVPFGNMHPGMLIEGQTGSWFSPVHGMRLLGHGGTFNLGRGATWTWYAGGQLDYLINLSYLLRGYNPDRMFELIGTIGLEGDVMRRNGEKGYQYGFGTSLQMRFNCAKAFYIYIEPRVAILEGTRYGGAKVDPYHMKAEPSLSVGLGYRILTGSARHDGSVDYKPIKDDNIFFGAGVGAWSALRDILHPNIDGHAYFGKMLSTASGLQITGAGGARPYKGSTRHYVFGTLDYVLDFDNALTGYRPDRVVNIQGNFGVGGACVLRDDHTTTIAPAFSAGLTALFKVAPNWAITIHPQAYVSSRKFFNELNSMRPVITSLDLGLRYTIGDFSRNYPDSYEDLADEGKRWFVTAGVGASKRFRYDQGVGGDVFIGFGRQITPVSSYRVAVTGVYYPQKPSAFDATLGIDYLASISTAMKGYDPTRLFDLQLLAGVQVGAANIDHSTEVTAGVKAGLQGNFRLNDRLDLFITPHVLASRLPVQGKSGAFVPELRCNVGVAYRLGK